MAQFDFHLDGSGKGYLVDCQADILNGLDTRLVVPLMPVELAPTPAQYVNPLFEIDGKSHSFVTQYAAAVPKRELGRLCGSLETERYLIVRAFDFMISGY